MSFFNKNLGSSQRYTGFTLSEVLVTLLIIGVIAGMTIPPLVNNIQNHQFREAFKKDFSVISGAGNMAKSYSNMNLLDTLAQNDPSAPTNTCPTAVLENLQPYLKFSKFCSVGTTSSGNCWHSDSNWSNYQGDRLSMSDVDFGGGQEGSYGKSMVLNDGTMIMMHTPSCTSNNRNYFAMMLIDVNGFKGPNVLGRDIQNISIYSSVAPSVSHEQFTFVPGYSDNNQSSWCTTGTAGNKISYGINCAKNIILGIDY